MPLDDLPLSDDERSALEAIVRAPVGFSWTKPPTGQALDAWRLECRRDRIPPAEAERWLAGLNGHGPAVGPLEDLGLVVPWHLPDGSRAVTLSGLAAEVLEVDLAAIEARELLPRWLNPGDVPPVVRMPRDNHVGYLALPELVRDTAPSVPELADTVHWTLGGTKLEKLLLWDREVPVDPRIKGKRASATTR